MRLDGLGSDVGRRGVLEDLGRRDGLSAYQPGVMRCLVILGDSLRRLAGLTLGRWTIWGDRAERNGLGLDGGDLSGTVRLGLGGLRISRQVAMGSPKTHWRLHGNLPRLVIPARTRVASTHRRGLDYLIKESTESTSPRGLLRHSTGISSTGQSMSESIGPS